MRIKGHHSGITRIVRQSSCCRLFQCANIWPHLPVLIFQLNQQRHLTCDQLQNLSQPRNTFIVANKRNLAKRRCCVLPYSTFLASQTTQIIVVKHHGRAVRTELQVYLNTVTACNRRTDRRAAVFRPSIVYIVQTAMGKRQIIEGARQGHLISNMPSISTATPNGKDAADTADRECRPTSPSASTRKSEAPLITAGCSP